MLKNKPYNSDQENDLPDLEQKEKQTLIKSSIDYLQKNPYKTWGWMVGILIVSILLNVLFSIFYTPKVISTEEALKDTEISVDPITQGLGKMVQASTSINETLAIKQNIDLLLSKKSLTSQDSVQLLSLFKQLEYVNKRLLPVSKQQK